MQSRNVKITNKLGMHAPKCGDEITITTDGAGENAALESLASLVSSGFGED